MIVEMVPIEKITLDLSNPRIARLIAMHKEGEISSEAIALALGAGDNQEGDTYATFRNLKASIKTNKGLIHPIIVNRDKSGQMTVIEGNTRLQIYREFIAERIEGEWGTIPAVIHEDLPQNGIDAIRLQAHLVGPRPWDPYSKARYLAHLSQQELLTTNQIVEYCGGKRKQVLEYIRAFNDMEMYYRPQLENEEDFNARQFSAFVELQKNRIQTALTSNKYSKSDFSKWVIDGKFAPLETVRALPEILANDEAKRVFLRNGQGAGDARIQLATQVNNHPLAVQLSEASFIDLSNELSRRLSTLKHADWKKMESNPSDSTRQSLCYLFEALRDDLGPLLENDDA